MGRCGKNTTEDQAQGEEQVGNVTTGFSEFDTSDNHMRECGGKEEERQDQQEHQSSALVDGVGGFSILVQTDGVVPAYKDDDTHERVPWKLDDDVCGHESLPRVGLGGSLANLV